MSLQALLNNPHEFDFFQAVYILEREKELSMPIITHENMTKIGFDGPLNKESLTFKVDPSLGFNGLSVCKIHREIKDDKPQKWQVVVAFLGLIGTNGVLPQHYTELVLQRLKARDLALVDFLNLFNHRLISLFYRAWEKYRVPIQYGRAGRVGQRDTFTQCIDSLTGNLAEESVFNYYAGFFAKHVRNATSLESMLSDFLAAPVAIEQFCGEWLTIDPQEQTSLKANSEFACLGVGTILGQQYWSVQNKIEIKIGPLTYQQYKNLLPGETLSNVLIRLIKQYINDGIKVSIQLWMNQQDMKFTQFGSKNACLGQLTWMSHLKPAIDKPEYISFEC
ncbi:type VI secretion system baseplate subunit TssG [Aliikangiella maris]|uniref:Type VI secretion system baseplate subunit TssG n=2 Tax=Aliikangiella maris TaxID=3162458 RepID=A0ABV3MND8_9GAMM